MGKVFENGRIDATVKDGIIYTEIEGELIYDMVVYQIDYIVGLRDQIEHHFEFSDLSKVTGINLSSTEMDNLGKHALATQNTFERTFAVYYAPNDFTFGMGRMFQTFFGLNKHRMVIEISKDRDEAIRWIIERQAQFG